MAVHFSVSRARAQFSQIINRVIYNKERFIVTKRGRKVAVILPFDEFERRFEGELLEAHPLPGDVQEDVGQVEIISEI